MSLLKWLRTLDIYIRKVQVCTSLTRKFTTDAPEENETSDNKKNRSPRNEVDVETSIEYLKSSAYQKAYGGLPVWTYYKRNFKGQFPPETRKNCVFKNVIATASPCPICRDEYLTVDYRNVDLIKQFISPYGGEILPSKKTGVCQFQYKKLLVEISKARDYGLLSFDVPHRFYNYNLYHKNKSGEETISELSTEEESSLTEN